jgi:hypothetical protein
LRRLGARTIDISNGAHGPWIFRTRVSKTTNADRYCRRRGQVARRDGTIDPDQTKIELQRSSDLDAPVVHLLWEDGAEPGDSYFALVDPSGGGDARGTTATDNAAHEATIRRAVSKRSTSYNYFATLSGLAGLAPTPFTEEPPGADERLVFEAMHRRFNRGSSASYMKFATEWGERVDREAKAAEGGLPCLRLRLKTIDMLYTWYDKKYKVADTADDPIVTDGACARIAQGQRKTRVEAAPAAMATARETWPPESAAFQTPLLSGHVPFGQRVTTPFNANAGVSAQRSTSWLAPRAPLRFAVGAPAAPPAQKPDGRRACSRCGRSRGEHATGEYGQFCRTAPPSSVLAARPPRPPLRPPLRQPPRDEPRRGWSAPTLPHDETRRGWSAPMPTPPLWPPPRDETPRGGSLSGNALEMALFWTNLTDAFARATPPRVFRRNAGTGHCWAEGVAFMHNLAFGTQMQPNFYLEMRAVAAMYMRSETYSAASYGFIYPRFVFLVSRSFPLRNGCQWG